MSSLVPPCVPVCFLVFLVPSAIRSHSFCYVQPPAFPDRFPAGSLLRSPCIRCGSPSVCLTVTPIFPVTYLKHFHPMRFPIGSRWVPSFLSRVLKARIHGATLRAILLAMLHRVSGPLIWVTLCICLSVTPRIACAYPRAFPHPFAHAFSKHWMCPLVHVHSLMRSAMSNSVRSPMGSCWTPSSVPRALLRASNAYFLMHSPSILRDFPCVSSCVPRAFR